MTAPLSIAPVIGTLPLEIAQGCISKHKEAKTSFNILSVLICINFYGLLHLCQSFRLRTVELLNET